MLPASPPRVVAATLGTKLAPGRHHSAVAHPSRPFNHKHSSRASLAGAGLLAAAFVAASMSSNSERASCESAAPSPAGKRDGFPIISKAEVAKHNGKEAGGVWVTYAGGVYDITDFIASHPGGSSRISMAAGSALEPFWKLYALHMKDEVRLGSVFLVYMFEKALFLLPGLGRWNLHASAPPSPPCSGARLFAAILRVMPFCER